MARSTVIPNSIKMTPTGELHPHPNNPRSHPNKQLEQIAASITRFGWTAPIIADEKGTVLAGHGRLYASTEILGLKEVPVITKKGLTEDEKRAYVIADNKLSDNAEWRYEDLIAEIEYLGTADIDIALMGFTDDDMLGLHSMVDDTGFPDDVAGQIIESSTEPTQLQGEGTALHRQEEMPEHQEGDPEPGDTDTGAEAVDHGKMGFTVELEEAEHYCLTQLLDGIIATREDVNTYAGALMFIVRAFDEDEEGSGDGTE